MATPRDRNKDYCGNLKNRVYLFVYEAEGSCANIPWNKEKPSEGFYILLGSFVLMVSLCVLYYDLILQEPTEGSATSNANASIHRHYNTPVTTPPSPILSRREYWI